MLQMDDSSSQTFIQRDPLGKLSLNAVVGGATLALIALMAGIGLWLDLRRRRRMRSTT